MSGQDQAVAAPATGLPPVLVGLTLVVVSLTLDLAWVLVPWTAAPPPPVDPDAGLPADVVARAAAVAASLRLPGLLSQAVGLLVMAGVVLSPPGRRLLGAVRRLPGGRLVVVPAQVLVVLVAVLVARWPFGVWSEQLRRDYGLSVRSWASFTQDRLVAAGMQAVLLVLAVVVVMALARRAPRWWPAVAAAGAAVLVVVVSLLYPLVVEPAFARLTPLADGPVRQQVEALSERAGAPVHEVLVADTSTRSTTLNAYVSGLGPTRRVVLQDTLLAGMTPPQVLSIVAHEISHAAAGDVWRGTALGAAGTASAVLLLGSVVVARPWRRRASTPSPAPARTPTPAPAPADSRRPASTALWRGGTASAGAVLLALTVVQVAATPVQSLVSRQIERAADVGAVTLTQDPAAFVGAQQTLLLRNQQDPSPPAWVQWWFGTHPTGAERVASLE